MVKRALLIRLGALGDTLHAASVACLLKGHYPDSEIDFLARAECRELLAMIPAVNQVFTLPWRRIPVQWNPRSADFLRELNQRQYDLVYLMETNPRFMPLFQGIKAKEKMAFGKIGEVEEEKGLDAAVPNPIRYQRALWALGMVPEGPYPVQMLISGEKIEQATDLIHKLGLEPDKPLVGLHPGNSFRLRKRWRRWFHKGDLRSWPEQQWCDLISNLFDREKQLQFVLFGSAQDRLTNKRILQSTRRRFGKPCPPRSPGKIEVIYTGASTSTAVCIIRLGSTTL